MANNGTTEEVCPDLKGPGQHARLPGYGQAYRNQLIGEFNSLKDVCGKVTRAMRPRSLKQPSVWMVPAPDFERLRKKPLCHPFPVRKPRVPQISDVLAEIWETTMFP
jgi:hypothetical protein